MAATTGLEHDAVTTQGPLDGEDSDPTFSTPDPDDGPEDGPLEDPDRDEADETFTRDRELPVEGAQADDDPDGDDGDDDGEALPEIPRAEGAPAAPPTPLALTPYTAAIARMSERSLSRSVGMNAYQKGRGYARRGNVLDSAVDGNVARGRVHGRAAEPYEVRVEVLEGGGFLSACSCPAWRGPERHCKHVAALLVALRDRMRPLREQLMAEAPARAAVGAPEDRRHSKKHKHRHHDKAELSGPREVVVVDRSGPRVVSAGATAGSASVLSGGGGGGPVAPLEQRAGWAVWLPETDPRRAPEFEYRLQPRTMAFGITVTLAENRNPVAPETALELLGPFASAHRPILRALARNARGSRPVAVELRGEDAAELLTLLRGRRVLVEPTLAELRFMDDPLVPKMELERTAAGVRVKVVFERRSDGRRLSISQGVWFEGAPGWQLDPIQATARPLADNVTPAWLERLSRAPAIVHPIEDLGRLLGELVPKAALALGTDLPELSSIVELVDLTPSFVLVARGDLTRAEVTLKASYGEVDLVVPPASLPSPLAVLPGDAERPRVIRRDIGAEREAVDRLFNVGIGLAEERDDVFEARGDKAVAFWTEGIGALPDDWDRFIPDDLVDLQVRDAPVLPRARVSSGVDWLALDVEFASEGCKVDEDDLRRALVEGRRLVRLEDGSFAPVARDQVEDVLTRMAEIFAQGRKQIPLSQAGRIQELLRLVPGARVEPQARELLDALSNRGKIAMVPPPRGLTATLRPYQHEGFSWLVFLHGTRTGGVLADDMGLGKTLQTLCLLLWLKDQGEAQATPQAPAPAAAAPKATAVKKKPAASARAKKPAARTETAPAPAAAPPVRGPRSLVVAPTSVVTNWLREIERFAPTLRAVAWTGPDREKRTHELDTADVVVTSYALLRRDEEFLQGYDFAYAILDEAQNVKNPLSATARAAKKLKSERRLALTGTPIENRLSELWSIFDFLSPGMLGDLSTFEDRYARPIDRGDQEAMRRVRGAIRPLVLRRLKTEVAKDLPEKILAELSCDLPARQRALYQQVLAQVRASVLGEIDRVGLARSQLAILAGLTRLRQAACDARLLKLPGDFDDDDSGKLDALREILSEAVQSGHRTLVFSQFVEMLTLIRRALEKDGVRYEYLDGSTRDRMERVDHFNTDEAVPVFLISLKAGGSGLNLTGADTVVHFDPWWNPAVEDQATDRAHRIGQTRVVTAYRLIARATIEEKIMALSARKRELVANVLGSEEGGVLKGLTRTDVENLFSEDPVAPE